MSHQAHFLGTSPLTILIGCTCGYRNYFSRQRWDFYRGGVCDNCSAWIDYNLRVRSGARGGLQVEITYKQTP